MKINNLYINFLKLYARLFAYPWLSKWNEFLVTVGLHGLGIDNYQDNYLSGERAFLEKIICKKSKPIIIDVGAHNGDSAILAKSINPHVIVHSFEPNPTTYLDLKKTAKQYGFKAYNMGLGEKIGKMTLYDSGAGDGSPFASLYPTVITKIHKQKLIRHKVKIITIDSFVKNNLRNKHIDLLKVDVEGYELQVIKGALNSIEIGFISAIQFEFNKMNVESRTFFKDFVNILPNFDFYRLLPHGMIKISSNSLLGSEIFFFQNIVALKKK